jgi:hypothetical protein
MLHVIVFIIMVLCAMLIWEKIFRIIGWGWNKIKLYRASKAVDNEIKKQKKRKATLKKQFESKGWRVAK